MAAPGRIPPVAAIRAAIHREQAVRALAGEPLVPPNEDPAVPRALLDRLHWPRDGTRRPWRAGLAMLGGPRAPWEGIGNVVKSWSSTSMCTVWTKVPMERHPEMRQWKSQTLWVREIAEAILDGRITDAYP